MKKTIATLGTVATVIFSSTFTAGPIPVSAEKNMNNLKSEQKELNNHLSKVEIKIKNILLDIEQVHNEIIKLQSEIEANNKAIIEAEKSIKKHEKEIDLINERIEERSEILKDRIASYQKVGGNVKFLEVILGSKSPLEFISRVDAVATVTSADQELIDEQEADLKKIELKMDELDQMKADLEGTHNKLKYDLEEEKKAKKRIAKKEKELNEEKTKIEGRLGSINSEIAFLESEIRTAMNEQRETAFAQIPNDINESSNYVYYNTNNPNDINFASIENGAINRESTNDINSSNITGNTDSTTGSINSNNTEDTGVSDNLSYTNNTESDTDNNVSSTSNSRSSSASNSTSSSASNSTSSSASNSTSSSASNSTSSSASSSTSNSSKQTKKSTTKATSSNTSSVISTAKGKIGTKYQWGGTSPSGFDCSGFVSWVYSQHGVELPRTAAGMGQSGTKVPSLSQAKPGDLVIFSNGGHVGIYLGNGKFIGSQTSTGVAIADMTSGYWAKEFDGNIRRIR